MVPNVTNPEAPLSSTSSSSVSLDFKKRTRIDDVTLRNQDIFDPWNSASTGHQRAEHTYSRTREWRQMRTEKLAQQFQGRPIDYAGSVGNNRSHGNSREGIGEWRWLSAEEAKRKELGCEDIRKYLGGLRKGRTNSISISEKTQPFPSTTKASSIVQTASEEDGHPAAYSPPPPPPSVRRQLTFCNNNDDNDNINRNHDNRNDNDNDNNASEGKNTSTKREEEKKNSESKNSERKIFAGLTFYINGSTSPHISDHKLKQLLAENGANISIALGRRTVTHVILGKPNNNNSVRAGAGGGLAAGKLQKEITRVGGKGVKFVGVEWVLESLKASKRLPEARFAAQTLHMASKNQPSVYNMFSKQNSK